MRPRAELLLGCCMLTSCANAGSMTNSMSKATLAHTTPPTLSTPTTASPRVCTNVWSTTETTITRPQFYGPTLVTILASRTITTLEENDPAPTSYPCTLTDTIISRVTYEYRMTFSDGHSSTSVSSAEYTIPTTRVQLLAPTATLTCGSRLN
ncbi:hypothetical protein CONLIGDRAFT_682668 [Coniochaeta ligniaria NRRL 30616]|uniref:Ig-like domain-containing protein n=1 Tax=Coniochaeta ligniaria NRRL 30616 TaxID=1408157 RepID=A0A1J7J2U7_9PEZI|nr:hypothetical protein CONLIGDRAFT_682668 [Coniochaeta ligniaria NRRL 30616]